jgi:hypothetical protein
MRKKYLNKITAAARFNTQILSKPEHKELNNETVTDLWRIYLISLAASKQISQHQANTWKYPGKIL